MSGKLRTLVWKTGVLTITQRPLTKSCIFHGLGGVMTAMAEAANANAKHGSKRTISAVQPY